MGRRSTADNVVQMPKQLPLDAGGATVDVSKIGSVTFAANMKDLNIAIKKGSDVEVRFVARCTGVDFEDKYDAHGNVAVTERIHDLRIDEIKIESVNADRFKLAPAPEPEPDEEGEADPQLAAADAGEDAEEPSLPE